MDFHPPTPATVAPFSLLCVAIVAAFLLGVRRSELKDGLPAGRRVVPVAVGVAVWLAAIAVLVRSGFVAVAPMPRLMFFAGGITLVCLLAGLLAPGRWIAGAVPIAALVAFQGFRLPLELILHAWAEQGTIPATMTWTGQNWDVVTGVTALVAAPFAARARAAAWIADVVGLLLLANVFRVVVLSSPLPFAWPVSPPLLLAFHLPYALIVPICVGGALFGHVALTRALLRPPA